MRIRTVKPAFWSNEKLGAVPDFARLLAIGLLNYADDEGFFWSNPKMIRGALFPFEEDSEKIRKGLEFLSGIGYLRLGRSSDGREVGQVVSFLKHQRIDKPTPSEIASCATFQEHSKNDIGVIPDHSPLDRKGLDRIGILAAEPPAPLAPARRDEIFDALMGVEGIPPEQLGKQGPRIGRARAEIKAITPDVTPHEVARRAKNYVTHFGDAALTAQALAKHWGKCHEPKRTGPTAHQRPNGRNFENASDFTGVEELIARKREADERAAQAEFGLEAHP